MQKRGTILVENIIFIILNILFIAILILFLLRQGSGAIVLEQAYAKQIALLVDSGNPIMVMKIDMEKGKKIADKNEIDFGSIVKIERNIVTVKLSDKGSYSYAFFNDIDASVYADRDDKNEFTGMYVLTINEKRGENE